MEVKAIRRDTTQTANEFQRKELANCVQNLSDAVRNVFPDTHPHDEIVRAIVYSVTFEERIALKQKMRHVRELLRGL